MDVILPTTAITVALASVLLVGSIILTLQKVVKNAKKDREEHAARILQHAKEEDALLKAKLEARVEKLDAQLRNLELNVNKDITHLKDVYSAEIKNLGDKIDTLRDELHNQHSQMVTLLSKIIDSK